MLDQNTGDQKAKHKYWPVHPLDVFRKELEKYFFAKVSIRILNETSDNIQLIVDVDCQINLVECLFHLKSGFWGGLSTMEVVAEDQTPLMGAFVKLQRNMASKVDIEEFSFHFQETSIIINKQQPYSIPSNLVNILGAIREHFEHYTMGLKKLPYEIFTQVFEEVDGLDINSKDLLALNNGYTHFWAFYFDDLDSPKVYDLSKKEFLDDSTFYLRY